MESRPLGEDNRKRILLQQEYVVETICKDLEREGYSVQPLLIPACSSERPIEETGCGLLHNEMMLPTPMATDIYHAKRVKELKDSGEKHFTTGKMGRYVRTG